MLTHVEKVPGGDRIASKLTKVHVSKRTPRYVLDQIEVHAGDEQHAVELAHALSEDGTLLPEATRQSLSRLLEAGCVTEVLTIKRPSGLMKWACLRS